MQQPLDVFDSLFDRVVCRLAVDGVVAWGVNAELRRDAMAVDIAGVGPCRTVIGIAKWPRMSVTDRLEMLHDGVSSVR